MELYAMDGEGGFRPARPSEIQGAADSIGVLPMYCGQRLLGHCVERFLVACSAVADQRGEWFLLVCLDSDRKIIQWGVMTLLRFVGLEDGQRVLSVDCDYIMQVASSCHANAVIVGHGFDGEPPRELHEDRRSVAALGEGFSKSGIDFNYFAFGLGSDASFFREVT
jgi:hypothetical protein